MVRESRQGEMREERRTGGKVKGDCSRPRGGRTAVSASIRVVQTVNFAAKAALSGHALGAAAKDKEGSAQVKWHRRRCSQHKVIHAGMHM
jgi:hypothetical protein